MRRANLKTKIMNKAQKFLLENNLDDIVLNAKQYPENTTENAEKWIYLSDVLEQYLALNQALRIHDVVGRSEQLKAFMEWHRQDFNTYNKINIDDVIKEYEKSL
jgi:hypothetical protein